MSAQSPSFLEQARWHRDGNRRQEDRVSCELDRDKEMLQKVFASETEEFVFIGWIGNEHRFYTAVLLDWPLPSTYQITLCFRVNNIVLALTQSVVISRVGDGEGAKVERVETYVLSALAPLDTERRVITFVQLETVVVKPKERVSVGENQIVLPIGHMPNSPYYFPPDFAVAAENLGNILREFPDMDSEEFAEDAHVFMTMQNGLHLCDEST